MPYSGLMAFIYLSAGLVLEVPLTREAVANDLQGAGPGVVLTYETDVPAGASRRRTTVSVAAANVAAVTDEPLTGP
jgi:hypothetical protein